MRLRQTLGCLVAACLLAPVSAFALEDCSAYLKEIDAKADAARAGGQDPSMVLEMRESLAASCAYLDEASVRKMVDSIDQLLPAMAAMKQYQQQAAEAAPAPAEREKSAPRRSAAASTDLPRTGHSLGGRFVDRPDPMHVFAVWDMDLERGRASGATKARVLYDTRPSLEQAVQPDWEQVIYVVEVDPAGEVVQHLVNREQRTDHAALALRRGAGEVLWQRQEEGAAGSALERWSIADRARLGSVPTPSPVWPDGMQHDWGPFRGPTADGNVFYMDLQPEPRGASTHTIAWFESTPDGHLVGRGSLTRPDELVPYTTVEPGSGAVTLAVRADSGEGIETRLDTPIERELAGRKMYATVAMEKRLLVLDDDARTFWESPALERMLGWHGEMGISQDLPSAERMQQNQQQMTLLAATRRAAHAGRTLVTLDSGFRRLEMIKPLSGDRYVALVNVTDDRRLEPPRHGPYLLEVSAAKVTERLYLEPVADALDARLQALAVSPADEMYVFASRRDGSAVVLKIEPDWTVSGYAQVEGFDRIGLDGMVADAAGVWVFGHGVIEGKAGNRLWVDRVVFDAA
ncbi:MAG: hypothetical protein PVH91_13840 [Pseudomonadales bacterium]|jgi:hypothetical protein